MNKSKKPQKVVIVGGGFGGIKTALNLSGDKHFEVTLVSDLSHFQYHSGLYRTVTGRSPLETVIPLTTIFKKSPNVTVELDRITEIDPRGVVRARTGNQYSFDKLVVAVGAVTNYFNIKGLAEYSLGMKTLADALELREHLHSVIKQAYHGQSARFVVVGAGPTGVELAAELCFYLKILCRQHDVDTSRIKIDLVEAADRVLPMLSERFSERAERRLKKLGVTVHLSTPVKSERVSQLELPGETLKTDTVVWTAGTTNHPLFKNHPKLFDLNQRGQVVVDKLLRATESIFVIGDNAATPFSGMAQTALHNADFVADNLKRQVRGKKRSPYAPKRPIYVIPVGSRWAGVSWRNVEFFGYLGWILRRVADFKLLFSFISLPQAWRRWQRGNAPVQNPCPLCTLEARSQEA